MSTRGTLAADAANTPHSAVYRFCRTIKPLRFLYRLIILQLLRYPRKIGVTQAIRLILGQWLGWAEFSIAVPGTTYPVWVRPRTSDIAVFNQIFIGEAYDLPFVIPAKLIFDLGANVGYASVYFAHRYPDARIVAVEPEARNFKALVKNTRPYPNIVTLEAAGPASHEKLVVDDSGSAWEFRGNCLCSDRKDMSSVDGVTIDDILNDWSDGATIDLLKIDIEGAERELFSTPCDSWLERTRIIVIELHDRIIPGCEHALAIATRRFRFLSMHKGEDTILVRNE